MSENEPASLEPVKTSDTSLAAFLHYKGNAFVGIMQDPNDYHRKIFVFVRDEETEDKEKEYQSGKITVHPKLYYKSIRIMHRMLREGREIEKN